MIGVSFGVKRIIHTLRKHHTARRLYKIDGNMVAECECGKHVMLDEDETRVAEDKIEKFLRERQEREELQ